MDKKISWPDILNLPLNSGIFECSAEQATFCGRILKIDLSSHELIIRTNLEVRFDYKRHRWSEPQKRINWWCYTFGKVSSEFPTAENPRLDEFGIVTFYSKETGINSLYPPNSSALEKLLRNH